MTPGAAPASRFVDANGLRHHVLEWPGPARRTVLVLHGYLDHAPSFVALGDVLAADGWRVLAPDLRGHGRTAWVGAGGYYHFPDYVADVDALVTQLAPEADAGALRVVGHSMGGGVASLWCGTRPERVRALVLAEGLGPPDMPAEVAPDRTFAWLEGLSRGRVRRRIESHTEAVERLRKSHGGAVPLAVLERVADALTEPHPSGSGLTWRFDPLHQTTSPQRFDGEALVAFLSRIRAPVLLVDGGDTGATLPEHATRAAGLRVDARVSLEGAGHMMHWTRPQDLAVAIAKFLASHG